MTVVTARRRERRYLATTLALVAVTWATLYWVRFVSEWFRARGWLMPLMIALFAGAALAVLSAVLRSRPRRLELLVLALFAALYAAAILPLVGRPEEALHFIQYGAVGGFAFAWLRERRSRRTAEGRAGWLAAPAAPALGAFLLAAGAGWIDEGIQHLLPNRYYDLRDVAFNAAAGALAGAGMAALGWARGRDRAAAPDAVRYPA